MNLTNIRTDARYLVSPQLTSTEYPDADLDRNANLWYRKAMSWAIEDQGEWELRGDILYRDFIASTTDYEIPSSFVRIFKAELMYATGGSFVPAKIISVRNLQGIAEGNSTRVDDDASQPTIEMFGDMLQVRPAPDATVVNGFKIWAQVDFDDLVNAHDSPDFPVLLHRILSVGAAMDFAVGEEMLKKYNLLKGMMYGDPTKENDKGLRGEVASLFANRMGAQRSRLVASRRTRFN